MTLFWLGFCVGMLTSMVLCVLLLVALLLVAGRGMRASSPMVPRGPVPGRPSA